MITIRSFGFKYGIPADCDLVFDVRFLPNPYYIPELKTANRARPGSTGLCFEFSRNPDFFGQADRLTGIFDSSIH